MKKTLMLVVLSAFAAGCGGPAAQTGVWQHDTLYRDWDHLRFSWGGHKEVSTTEVVKSREEGWWGKEVPAVPVK